jgi:hypothetical protein
MTYYQDYVIPLQNKPHFLDGIITKITHTILLKKRKKKKLQIVT